MKEVQIAVVGGGPAGLSAAIAAARVGAEVLLLDENPTLGGQLRYRIAELPGITSAPIRAPALAADLIAEASAAGVDTRANAVAWGLFDRNVLGVVERAASYLLAAERLVLTTGSVDLPLPFPGWTLPGVLTARAMQILLHGHRVLPGRRCAVIGAGPDADEVAGDVALAGGEVAVQIDPAEVGELIAVGGDDGVRSIVIDGKCHEVDVIVIAVGRQPDPQLALMAGCRIVFAAELGGFVPARDQDLWAVPEAILVAGDAAGVCDVAVALAEGRFAGVSAAASLGLVDAALLSEERARFQEQAGWRTMLPSTSMPDDGHRVREPSAQETRRSGERGTTAASGGPGTRFLCRCEEVTADQVRAAIASGALTVNDVKRRTRAGMGICQGAFCVSELARAIHGAAGAPLAEIAPMTARPPTRLVSLAQLAEMAM